MHNDFSLSSPPTSRNTIRRVCKSVARFFRETPRPGHLFRPAPPVRAERPAELNVHTLQTTRHGTECAWLRHVLAVEFSLLHHHNHTSFRALDPQRYTALRAVGNDVVGAGGLPSTRFALHACMYAIVFFLFCMCVCLHFLLLFPLNRSLPQFALVCGPHLPGSINN